MGLLNHFYDIQGKCAQKMFIIIFSIIFLIYQCLADERQIIL